MFRVLSFYPWHARGIIVKPCAVAGQITPGNLMSRVIGFCCFFLLPFPGLCGGFPVTGSSDPGNVGPVPVVYYAWTMRQGPSLGSNLSNLCIVHPVLLQNLANPVPGLGHGRINPSQPVEICLNSFLGLKWPTQAVQGTGWGRADGHLKQLYVHPLVNSPGMNLLQMMHSTL